MRRPTVLIVEDEAFIQNFVSAYLEAEGYSTTVAGSGREMLSVLDRKRFDLVLLDLGLPDEDGLALARKLRMRSSVPVIVLTSRTDLDDRLAAFENGVDDFVNKDVDPRELLLRMKRLAERSRGNQSADQDGKRRIAIGEWVLDLDSRTLGDGQGNSVELTRSEFDLLSALFRNSNRVLTRAQLLDAVSHATEEATDRTIDVLVSRLRKKMERDSDRPHLIVTVHGVGYKIAGEEVGQGHLPAHRSS
jgi:two-component system torCAD operon response regulator TorR